MTDPAPAAPTQTADRAATWPAVVPAAPADNLPAKSPSVERYGETVDQGHEDGRMPVWAPGFDPGGNEQHRNAAHAYLTKEFGAERANRLWDRWGGGENFGKNLHFAATFIGRFPELDEIASRWGLHDHPCLLEMGAVLGRRFARQPGNPKSIPSFKQQDKPMSDDVREQIDQQIRDNRKAIAEAQSEGDHRRANDLYSRQLGLIGQRDGSKPIVGGAGRRA